MKDVSRAVLGSTPEATAVEGCMIKSREPRWGNKEESFRGFEGIFLRELKTDFGLTTVLDLEA